MTSNGNCRICNAGWINLQESNHHTNRAIGDCEVHGIKKATAGAVAFCLGIKRSDRRD